MNEVELPKEALDVAASVRGLFPGLTDPEIAIKLLHLGMKEEGLS